MFRQRLFFSCYHSKDAKEQSADSKKEDDLHWIHLFDCMGNVSDCKERFLFLLEFIVFIYDIVKVLHRFVMVSHGLLKVSHELLELALFVSHALNLQNKNITRYFFI